MTRIRRILRCIVLLAVNSGFYDQGRKSAVDSTLDSLILLWAYNISIAIKIGGLWQWVMTDREEKH